MNPRYNTYPRLFGDTTGNSVPETIAETWRPTPNDLQPSYKFTFTEGATLWRVYHVRKGDLPCTLMFSQHGDHYISVMLDELFTEKQIPEFLGKPHQKTESTHHPLDPYSPEDRKRFNEESWTAVQKRIDETGVAPFRGPLIGPWIEHSDHKYSRSWHPSFCGGGPAAVVQGHGPRYNWFAWQCLLGCKTGEETGEDALKKAMAAVDQFLAGGESQCPNWTYHPLAVSISIEASPWEQVVGDQWSRTWNWPGEKVAAACILQHGEEFHFTCWDIHLGCIGDGKANDLRAAKDLADDMLSEYCQKVAPTC